MKTLLLLSLFVFFSSACTKKLVSDETIRNEKKLTQTLQLKNGIPMIVREVSDSPIVALGVTFNTGIRHAGFGKDRLASRVMWTMMGSASKNFPKEKVNEFVEKYSLTISCGESLERSSCTMNVIDEYFADALPLFVDLIVNPSFTQEDFKLATSRLEAGLKATPSDPASYVNEVVNRIFYPKDHPFSPNYEQELSWLAQVKLSDIRKQHENALNSKIMSIVQVGGRDQRKIQEAISHSFSKIGPKPIKKNTLDAPLYNPKASIAFEHRDIPTAYLRFKFNAPAAGDPDYAASKLMFHILSKELSDEVRTKLSLSYAVYSFTAQLSIGYGVIEAWTSKPEETLAAIKRVVEGLKNKELSKDEIEEFKIVSATNYFLGLETNSSIGNGLSNAQFYLNDAKRFYDYPRDMERVRPQDVKRIANKVLKDFRLGVVYHKDKFKTEWFTM